MLFKITSEPSAPRNDTYDVSLRRNEMTEAILKKFASLAKTLVSHHVTSAP